MTNQNVDLNPEQDKNMPGQLPPQWKMLNAISLPIIVAQLSDGSVLFANQQASDLFGIPMDQTEGRLTTDYFADPKDRPRYVRLLKDQGQVQDAEFLMKKADGSTFWASLTTQATEYQGEPATVTTVEDFTARMQVEEELMGEKALSDATINGLPGIFYLFEPDGGMVRWNEEYASVQGYAFEEIGDRNALDAIADEDKERTAAAIQRVFTEGQASIEANLVTKDGVRIPYHFVGRRLQMGDQMYVAGAGYDISERMKLEQQVESSLERRNEQLRVSTEVAQQIAAATQLEELFERVVTLTKDQFDYYHTQLLRYDPALDAVVLVTGYGETGKKMLEMSHQMPMGSGLIGTAAETGETVMRPDLADDPEWAPNPLLPDTKGEIAVPIKWQETVLGVLDVQVDQANTISNEDRLLLEGLCDQIAIAMHSAELVQDVQTSQERYELAVAGSNDGLWDWDIPTNQVYFSPRWKAMIGYDEDELTGGFADFEKLLHPEDHDRVLGVVNDYLTGKIPSYDVEFRFRHKDGSYRWILARGTAIRDENGAPIRMAGSHTDITGRLEAQQELRTSQERYELAVAGSNDGLWDWDIPTNQVYFSPRWKAMIGYDEDELTGGFADFEKLLHPEDHDHVLGVVNDYLTGKIPSYDVEFRFRHKDGSYRWILARGTAIRDESGAPIRMAGSHTDITERRAVQESIEAMVEERTAQLQDSETRFRSFFDNSADAYLIIDEGLFVDCNQATVDMLRASDKEEVLDTHPSQLSPEFQPDGRPSSEKADEMIQIAIDQGSNRFEWTHRRIDGEDFPVEVLLTPIQLGEKQVIYTVWRDITNRKRLERATQEAFERRGYQVQVSTEISQEIAEATELSELFDRVVDLTKERLDYYHTQLLRHDPVQDVVVLISGYGETGGKMAAQGHRMPMGSGLIGTAAATGETVMRPDLAEDPDWQPNPLLPETRGEVAVPIKLGDEVLGVLDVQSDTAGALTEDDRLLLEGLCGQVAIAMEQTRLRQEMSERLDEINRLYRAMSREGWQEYRGTTDLPKGFQFDQAGLRTVDDSLLLDDLFAKVSLSIPGGEVLGELAVADESDNPLSNEEKAFLEQVSEQIALALESARLSEQTQMALARTDELYGISQAINEADTEAKILEALARPAAENGAVSAILMYLDLDETGTPEWTETVADWRVEGEAPIPIGTRFYLPEMPLSKLWMADPDNPLLISDVKTDERVDDVARGLMLQGGSQALAIIPLTRGDEQIAMLIFNWDQTHQFNRQEEETYRAIIGLASPAVQSRRLFAQTQAALDAVQESEAQLGEALDIAKLGYWEYDLANDEFILTDNFYAIFHTTAEEMGGYRMSSTDYSEKFVHPEDAPLVGQEIERSLATTERFFTAQLEHRILYQDGGEGHISVNINLERDEEGNIIRWYGANQDITERKLAEEAVRESQERAQTILESVTLPMVISRLSDNILTFINAPATEVARMKYEDVINQPAPNFYYDLEDRDNFFNAIRETGRVTNMEMRFLRGDGEPFWALVSSRIFEYQDEPSVLTTFSDISDRIEAQEATVKRAAELATVADVGTTISTILDEQQLLETVVQLTRERFDLYHCHIFLADENNQTLQVKACGWEEGSPHVGTHADTLIHTDQEQSLVAQAARGQNAVIVNNVQEDPNWLPNELLPDTRSEMAVPMVAANQVLGVLDVQSNEVDRFTDEDISIMTTLASQVAVALQNARTYAQTQQQAEHEALINLISQRIQSTTSVENALQVAIRELGRALGAKRTNVQLGLPNQKDKK
jgi:PAS domain S-box-containing protein